MLKVPPPVSSRLALPRPLRKGFDLPRQVQQVASLHVPDHRHHQAGLRVDGDPEVLLFMQEQVAAFLVHGGVERRVLPQCHADGGHDEREVGEPGARPLRQGPDPLP
jgi:hypothetical protein